MSMSYAQPQLPPPRTGMSFSLTDWHTIISIVGPILVVIGLFSWNCYRNNANASDIASVLGGVAAALNGDRNV